MTAFTNLIMSNDRGRLDYLDYLGGPDPTLVTTWDLPLTYWYIEEKKKIKNACRDERTLSMNQSANPQHIMANTEAAAASWAEPKYSISSY